VAPSADPARAALENRRAHARTASLIVAAAGAGLVAVLVLAAVVLRRGRRRGWRPA
jgi:formate-dependent nitrite reductase membrane component NrfD